VEENIIPVIRKDLAEHDVQSLPKDYKPRVSMSQSMPFQSQLEP